MICRRRRALRSLLAMLPPLVASATAAPVRADTFTLTAQPDEPLVDIFDPAVLAALEARGFSFGAVTGDDAARNNQELWASARTTRYRDIATVLIDDLRRFEAEITGTRDDGHQFVIRRLAKDSTEAYEIERNGDAPRQLDARWFDSPLAFFKLVAVVNRYDRRDLDLSLPCGEIRLIYRLAYRSDGTPSYRSSLPLFFNVVLAHPASADCRASLALWRKPEEGEAGQGARSLAEGALRGLSVRQVEVNFQSLRFSGGYMTDFGGQALYIMRIFRAAPDGHFAPIPLENTPDVEAVTRDPALQRELLAFLARSDNLTRLDEGTLVLPNFGGKFLSTLAVSYSTVGRARLANKPYRRIFLARDSTGATTGQLVPEVQRALGALDLAGLRLVASVDGLIERLDNATCMGCHQSGGTAGFHVLGLGDEGVSDSYNQAELPFSPHYQAERARRAHYVGRALAGASPPRFRPHSFYPVASWDGPLKFSASDLKGQCLPDTRDFRIPLSCGDDRYRGCSRVAVSASIPMAFGDCVVYRRGEARRLFAGSACRKGRVEEGPARGAAAPLPASTFAFLDTFVETEEVYPGLAASVSEEALNCRPTSIGVPLGRTFRRCSPAEKRLDDVARTMAAPATPIPDELCAPVGGSQFEACAQGNDVLSCLRSAITRGMVDTCYPGRSCREDYICQRIPRELPGVVDRSRIDWLHQHNVGFCTPTYFLFNMRADGHPDPHTGLADKLDPARRAKEHRGGWTRQR